MHEKIINKTFFSFFVPTVISNLFLSVFSLSQMFLAGYFFGHEGLLVVGFTLPFILLSEAAAFLIGMGSATILAVYMGKGEKKEANEIFTLAVILSVVLGFIIMVAGLLFLTPVTHMAGAKEGILFLNTKSYLSIFFMGMAISLLSAVLMVLLRNDNVPWLAMAAMMMQSVSAVLLNFLFFFFTSLGIKGMAAAGIISQGLVVIMAFGDFVGKESGFTLRRCKRIWDHLTEILKTGFSGVVIFIGQAVLVIVINRYLYGIGHGSYTEAFIITKYFIIFAFAVFDGVHYSIQPMLGVYYGEDDVKSIRMAFTVSIKV